MMKMWKTMVSYLPDWQVFMQAVIVFFVPYVISRFFKWISKLEEE
ncbi:spore germination protein [Bacillus fengqiuensis]|nr:spore germination protein [Bacillus fengqiuensis]